MKKYLLKPNNIIIATNYQRTSQGFLDKLRKELKKTYPSYKSQIDSHLNNSQLRFDLDEIKEIEYDDDFKIKTISGKGWTNCPNGNFNYKKFTIYKKS